MLEFIIITIGALILITLRKLKTTDPPELVSYFSEQSLFPLRQHGKNRELLFYTVAEFNESRKVGPSGLEKSLGFSKFAFIYDCQEERIRTARIEFSASDGFKRDTIIGVWNYLNEEKDWLEIKIHFSLAEYDTFLDELRRYAASRTSTDQHFLLYSISAEAGAISNSGRNINLIYSISNRGVYPERNAHKIHVMSKLDEGRSNPDLRYRHLCEDKMQNFFKLIEDKN